MDFDQIGNGPNQSEIELLYNEALTAFADELFAEVGDGLKG